MTDKIIFLQSPDIVHLSDSSYQIGQLVKDYFPQVIAAFAGGFFAAYFTNHYESKRRLVEKRREKYMDHKNTIVQLEHELIPMRVNLSRDLSTIDGLNDSPAESSRLIMRMYDLSISTGLSLRLLNLKLVNMYSELFSLTESINSDIKYLDGMVKTVHENLKDKDSMQMVESVLNSYIMMASILKNKLMDADKKSLDLVAYCRVVLSMGNYNLEEYIKVGEQVNYKFSKSRIFKEKKIITGEEGGSTHKGEKPIQFFAPYFDIRKIVN
jgi:hypothetical protein